MPLVAVFLAVTARTVLADALETRNLVVDTGAAKIRFVVEIADDPAERAAGLMFRQSMDADKGMLFVYPSARPVTFWMKNTLLPLDMLFISESGAILSIAHDAVPMTETPIASGGDVLWVLEINGGLSQSLGIQPGARVEISQGSP